MITTNRMSGITLKCTMLQTLITTVMKIIMTARKANIITIFRAPAV